MLKVKQVIMVDEKKYKILGYVVFHTYNEYYIEDLESEEKFWLEENKEWRLWKEVVNMPFRISDIMNAYGFLDLLGKSIARLDGLKPENIYFTRVKETRGEVDEIEKGDKMVCSEGDVPGQTEFNLWAVEIWGDEAEYWLGKVVEVV
jgi:hypothetical protein